uniref:Uncharacterized protein n=1 Tax=Plectus sambesii TaxID=2011161 RepID=A0A914WN33_9BILA
MKKLSNGSQKQQDKEMQMRKVTLERCIIMDKARLNQMKKLSNGSQNQQNKDTQIVEHLLDICCCISNENNIVCELEVGELLSINVETASEFHLSKDIFKASCAELGGYGIALSDTSSNWNP